MAPETDSRFRKSLAKYSRRQIGTFQTANFSKRSQTGFGLPPNYYLLLSTNRSVL